MVLSLQPRGAQVRTWVHVYMHTYTKAARLFSALVCYVCARRERAAIHMTSLVLLPVTFKAASDCVHTRLVHVPCWTNPNQSKPTARAVEGYCLAASLPPSRTDQPPPLAQVVFLHLPQAHHCLSGPELSWAGLPPFRGATTERGFLSAPRVCPCILSPPRTRTAADARLDGRGVWCEGRKRMPSKVFFGRG